jgi:hypothetical protein
MMNFKTLVAALLLIVDVFMYSKDVPHLYQRRCEEDGADREN